MTRAAVLVVALAAVALSCRAGGDSHDAGASTSASATRAAERAEEDAADLAALCVLASVPRPPRGADTGLGSWNTALLSTKSKKLVGWVQLAGAATTKEDANWFFTSLDGGRFNMNIASGTCGRFRRDPARRTLVTAVIRTSGDARNGDYLVYASVGTAPDMQLTRPTEVKGVDDIGARVAALKAARSLLGEPFDSLHLFNDGWHTALEKVTSEP